MNCELKSLETDDEWEAYHSIRERVLWDLRGRVGSYDRRHPDEHKPDHHPLLLMRDGDAVGVVRVDLEPPLAWFRRVAVREDVQRQGYGRRLIELAQAFAAAQGCTRVRSNVDAEAVGFYRKLGFHQREGEHSGGTIPMEKNL